MSASKLRDVRKLADARAVFELDIPLAQLPDRPAMLLVDSGGPVHVQLSFSREQGFAVAEVALQAQLMVTCQRCLSPMPLSVDTRSPVLIVESEQESETAPAGWETFLAPEGRLTFEALAAEELLLALPIVPLHEGAGECSKLTAAAAEGTPAAVPADEEASARPFADLRAMLAARAKHP